MIFPEPVVSITMEGRGGTDSQALGGALKAFCLEDPTLRMSYGPGPGQWTLSGMGELHLAIVEERLKSDFGIDVTAGKPQVSYRKTVQETGHGRCEFEKRLPDGRTMLAANEISGELAVLRFDASSGTLAPTGKSLRLPRPIGLAARP